MTDIAPANLTPPPDRQIIAAFERGMARGQVLALYGNENPYASPRRSPWLRDAWQAGFQDATRRAAIALHTGAA